MCACVCEEIYGEKGGKGCVKGGKRKRENLTGEDEEEKKPRWKNTLNNSKEYERKYCIVRDGCPLFEHLGVKFDYIHH